MRAMRTPVATLVLAVGLACPLAAAEVEPAFSLEVGGPQKLSANLGFKIGSTKPDDPEVGRGFFFQVQPGPTAPAPTAK